MGKLNDESFIWYIRDALVILFLRKQRLRHSELDSESRVFAFASDYVQRLESCVLTVMLIRYNWTYPHGFSEEPFFSGY